MEVIREMFEIELHTSATEAVQGVFFSNVKIVGKQLK